MINLSFDFLRNSGNDTNDEINQFFSDEYSLSSNINQNKSFFKQNDCYLSEGYNKLFHQKDTTKEKKENKLEIIIKSQFPTNKTSEDIENIEENIVLNEKNIYEQKRFNQDQTETKFNDKNQLNNIESEDDVKNVKTKAKYGRKKLDDIIIRKHNKKSEDNIINKLKGKFFNHFIIDFIKKNSISKKCYIKKIPNKFISDLNKNRNERIYKMKLKDILCEQVISTKYKLSNKDANKKIIDKIYKEQKEKNVIKILELTFEELFIIFRRRLNDEEDMKRLEEIKNKIEGIDLEEKNNEYKDIKYFIELFKNKNCLNADEVNEYIEKVKNVCLSYIEWFNAKVGRTSKKIKI